MKKFIVLLFIFIVVACNSSQDTVNVKKSANTKQTIKIGLIAPLTGGLASAGNDIALYYKIAAKYFSQKSKKYNYEFIIEDGKCGQGSGATTSAKKLINIDKIDFLFTSCSGETLQAAPLAQAKKIITFAIFSSHKDVKFLGDYVFRTYSDAEKTLTPLINYLDQYHLSSLAVMNEENTWTLGIYDILKSKLGEGIVSVVDFKEGDADLKSALIRIKASNPKAVFFNTVGEASLAYLMNLASQLDLKAKIFAYAHPDGLFFDDPKLSKNWPEILYLGLPKFTDKITEYNKLYELFIKEKGSMASNEVFVRTFYDAFLVLNNAINAVGLDADLIQEYIFKYQGEGSLGHLSFDKNGDLEAELYVMKRFFKGERSLLSEQRQ